MKLGVLGSTGRTGKLVVQHALDRGHDVKALARRPETVTVAHPHLAVVQADAHDAEAINAALAGCDAVISALGIGASRKPTTVYSDGARNVLSAMASHNIDRLAVISASPAGDRSEQPFMDRRVMMPILDLFFGTSYQDMRRMEAVLARQRCQLGLASTSSPPRPAKHWGLPCAVGSAAAQRTPDHLLRPRDSATRRTRPTRSLSTRVQRCQLVIKAHGAKLRRTRSCPKSQDASISILRAGARDPMAAHGRPMRPAACRRYAGCRTVI